MCRAARQSRLAEFRERGVASGQVRGFEGAASWSEVDGPVGLDVGDEDAHGVRVRPLPDQERFPKPPSLLFARNLAKYEVTQVLAANGS